MPNLDGTGPNGDGPQTGRGRGIKRPQQRPQQKPQQRPQNGQRQRKGNNN